MSRHASEPPIGDKIILWREHLEGISNFPLPPGFSLRWYQPGDQEIWFRIQTASDQLNEITPELFQQQFGNDDQALAKRQCYLLTTQGRAVGTATAWYNDNFEGRDFGRVHWVAILPDYQGRGLARPLMTAICERLRELGHKRAYLTTSTARLGAIRLYLRFGFSPLIRNPAEAALWHSVEDKMPATFPRNFFRQPHSNQ
jgi:GNAT superfamily N-acetyltransferase